MHIASIGRALPEHFYDQETLIDALRRHWGARHRNLDRLESIHRNAAIGGRHLALPIDEYESLTDFTKTNAAFVRCAVDLGERAIADGLAAAGLTPRDIDHLFFVSITGVAAPSVDAMLVNRMGLRADVKRTPIFGLGCMAGAAGITKAVDYVRAYPDQVAVVLSVELCSLTLQRTDLSVTNIVASGLFGDAAAALVVVGAERGPRSPSVLATRSVFYPDTERVMGWDVTSEGFKIVLSGQTPQIVAEFLPADVNRFLADNGATRDRIATYVFHPGGPRVLQAFEDSLGLTREDLELSWRNLMEVGNVSSASIYLILRDFMETRRPEPGALGLTLAMGPGFCAELGLLQW